VLPTYLVVALEPGRPATLEPTRQLRGVLRLDQTAALEGGLRSGHFVHIGLPLVANCHRHSPRTRLVRHGQRGAHKRRVRRRDPLNVMATAFTGASRAPVAARCVPSGAAAAPRPGAGCH
jgi:hypothetical protein